MGKVGGSSWLAAVKRAFRSPTKDNEKRSCRRRENQELEDEEKKRGKRRWMFRKPSTQETVIQHSALCKERSITTTAPTVTATSTISETTNAEQRHALAVAMATTAAAQAAVATAQAAVEVARLTRPNFLVKQNIAAMAIQTAFRGYLARRALRALKGLVKLQALVRGHNVRKRAKMTLHCMQALMRVQARVRDERMRVSYEGSTHSISSDHHRLLRSYLADGKSICRDESSSDDHEWVNWDDHPQSMEKIQAIMQEKKEVALEREKGLASAFSRQIWRSSRDTYASEGELEEKPRWRNDHRNPWENRGRVSTDYYTDPIKTVEVDTFSTPKTCKSHEYYHYQQQRPSSFSVASPLTRAHNNFLQPTTRPHQVQSASPRYQREARGTVASSIPNYMAATESAKARIRSQSAPRRRPSTPEREKMGCTTTKKRLSFPVPADPETSNSSCTGNIVDYYTLRSPSYNIHEAYLGTEQRSIISSCRTDSNGDEVSPPSTKDLSRWLR